MPVSPTPDESYYWEIALAYRDAELAMLEQIKNRLLKGQTLDDQAWATARLAEIQTLRRENTAVLRAVNTSMASKIAGSIGNAYKDGELAALKDTKAFLPERPSAITSQARRASVAAIAREVTGGVATASSGVLRQAEDKYREVVQRVVTSTATGAVDRRTATDQALKAALGAGLKTGPDSRMTLESYIEMATRTGVAKAMIEGHTEAMAANGIDLVYIHPGPRACEVCDIWGNTVLWREGGPTGVVVFESMVGDDTVEVLVSGTLPQARGAGWGHPNCRCSIGGYIPGATELLVNRPPWDQEGYEAQQRQREIERHIRDWKRKAALSTNPADRAAALLKVEQWQAAQRAHMSSNPFLKRQYGREGVGGYKGAAATTPQTKTPSPTFAPAPKQTNWKGADKPTNPGAAPAMPPSEREVAVKQWEADVAARFKAFAETTGNLKADIKTSHNYYLVKQAMEGDKNAVKQLLSMHYIDDKLYQQLNDALFKTEDTPSASAMSQYNARLKEHEAAQKKYEADLAAWRKANGVTAPEPRNWDGVLVHTDDSEGTKWANKNLSVPTEGTIQFKSTHQYTGGSYKPWNAALRAAAKAKEAIEEQWATLTKQMDKAMKPAPVDVVVRRGTTGEELNGGKSMESQDILGLAGSTYVQHGYTSTSVGRTAAFGGKQVELDILVPKGHPTAWVDPYSQHKGERELILARSTQFYIHDVYDIGYGRVRVVVEAVAEDVDTSEWTPSPPTRYGQVDQ